LKILRSGGRPAGQGRHRHDDIRNTGQPSDKLFRLPLKFIFDRACRSRERDIKGNVRAVDPDVLHKPQAHDIAVKIRIDDTFKRI
jgi:hypothetical protein